MGLVKKHRRKRQCLGKVHTNSIKTEHIPVQNIEIDKQGNKKEANIYGQWSFGDPSFSTIYLVENITGT